MEGALEGRVTTRPARPADAEAIARIHVDAFEATYRGLLPDGVIDVRTSDVRRRQWAERLPQLRPREWVVVADVGGEVAGFMSARTATVDEGGDGTRIACWENLYLDTGKAGTGTGLRLGLELHTAMLSGAVERGFAEAVNFVVVGNDRARRFFEALGWRADGFVRVSEGIESTRLRRRLTPAP